MMHNAEGLLNDLGNEILDRQESKKRYSNIFNDAEALVNKSPPTRSQNKMLQTLLLLKEIKESDEQPRPRDMFVLESEEFTLEGKGIKILTSGQALSTLSITLAQLKARNNSEKLKNEIRQLLHSLYRSKKINQNDI